MRQSVQSSWERERAWVGNGDLYSHPWAANKPPHGPTSWCWVAAGLLRLRGRMDTLEFVPCHVDLGRGFPPLGTLCSFFFLCYKLLILHKNVIFCSCILFFYFYFNIHSFNPKVPKYIHCEGTHMYIHAYMHTHIQFVAWLLHLRV